MFYTCKTKAAERITICMRPNDTFSLIRERPIGPEARYSNLKPQETNIGWYAKGSEDIVRFTSKDKEITFFIKKDAYAVWPTQIEARGLDVTKSTCVAITEISEDVPLKGNSRALVTSIITLGTSGLAPPIPAPPAWPQDMISN